MSLAIFFSLSGKVGSWNETNVFFWSKRGAENTVGELSDEDQYDSWKTSLHHCWNESNCLKVKLSHFLVDLTGVTTVTLQDRFRWGITGGSITHTARRGAGFFSLLQQYRRALIPNRFSHLKMSGGINCPFSLFTGVQRSKPVSVLLVLSFRENHLK